MNSFASHLSSSSANLYTIDDGAWSVMIECGAPLRRKGEKIVIEHWKDVPGWEGIYSISNHGRVKSFKKDPSGRILSHKNQNGWYLTLVLCVKGRQSQTKRIHVLVAQLFVSRPEGKTEVNHKDGNKQNNHWLNLEWVTRKENIDHSREMHPDYCAGMNHYNKFVRPKPIEQLTPITKRFIARFPNAQEAGRATGVCSRNISQVADQTEYLPGKTRRQAGGYVWRYANASGL